MHRPKKRRPKADSVHHNLKGTQVKTAPEPILSDDKVRAMARLVSDIFDGTKSLVIRSKTIQDVTEHTFHVVETPSAKEEINDQA